MKKIIVSCTFILLTHFLVSQTPTQTIKGMVLDKDSQESLIGATVMVDGFDDLGITTDIDGNYKLENVPVGLNECPTAFF